MDVFVINVDLGEDGLVEQAADLIATVDMGCPDVRTVAVRGVVESTREGTLELFELHVSGGQAIGDLSEAASNTVLLSLE
ncbi:hypothetical protein [Mycobacteroides abscessus]|uniref:hypothetical protein n=1 Tax=Mycobacteroides abscessus TaxID=36809 RepID=UPI0013F667AB|nr:hypothetical protein [Mycobacteroides abscessus]